MTVHVSNVGCVRTITIDRPERRNAVDPETALALREAFVAFDADATAAVAVLTGEGTSFCAGYDLTRVDAQIDYEPEGPGPMGPTRMMLNKPVIAAVEGHAVAGGLELALWCDLRVVSHSAIFGVFCRRWGVPLIDGGTVRLPRLIGHSRALDMILTGRPVHAEEAFSIGLANRLVVTGNALMEAQALAAKIAKFPALCMQTDRLSAYAQWGLPLVEALEFEGREGEKPLRAEASAGAARFVAGKGRAGRPE